MPRAFILVLDSFGVGGAPDAARYGDSGANTLGHIAQHCATGKADQPGLREGPLALANLNARGLGMASVAANGHVPPGLSLDAERGAGGCAAEISTGKDSQSGHWEIAGAPVTFDWGYFPDTQPSFPPELIAEFCKRANLPGILGDRHASGTQIIAELGEEHLRSGKPICYTSGDSVFQIAAHEQRFGLERLYQICKIARELVNPLRIGRVIARPFIGDAQHGFERTGNRHDYGVMPPQTTLLHRATDAQRSVISVGKIGDLFCHDRTGHEVQAHGNDAVFDRMLEGASTLEDGGLLFANFVDFDTLFGHRRDVAGYAAALEAFDRRLPEFDALLRRGDLAIITGDHGCDPTWHGTDHTRECVPILAFGAAAPSGALGKRKTFADIGAAVARHLALPTGEYGTAF
jgi:phosphopentomutase